MPEVSDETIRLAYKPFDVVSDEKGNVGFIQEVSVNHCQPDPKNQIQYCVHWMRWIIGTNIKSAWFDHGELTRHCNLFAEIAKCVCHPHGGNSEYVDRLMKWSSGGKGE